MLPGTAILLCLTVLGSGPADPVTPSVDTDPVVIALRAEQAQAIQSNDTRLAREIEARIQGRYLQLQGRDQPVVLHDAVWHDPTEVRGDAPDGLIRTGTIQAFATDYQMDGTMWVASTAWEDSFFDIHKSTDHGASWQRVVHTASWVSRRDRIGLVVGEGESAFVYLFLISTYGNGDLGVVRYRTDGYPAGEFPILRGSETVNNMLVCRDYTGNYYWLYALAGDDDETMEYDEPFLRSTDYGRTWAVMDTFRWFLRGSLSAGAGTWLYACAGRASSPGMLLTGVNTYYGAHGYWRFRNIQPDTFQTMDPSIAAAFTTPESTAVIWVTYSHNYHNSGDWDALHYYSTDGGVIWSGPGYLGGSPDAVECYPDVKNYTSPGNSYVNVSYVSWDDSAIVYRRYANAGSPGVWSDPVRINEHSAGLSYPVRPQLVYSPGSPGTGAGCVFSGGGRTNLYWNAPWHSAGLAGQPPPNDASRLSVSPNPCHGKAVVSWPGPAGVLRVFDAAGRLVMRTGTIGSARYVALDLGQVVRGVYFVSGNAGKTTVATALIVE
jgi:hypothetical protein